MTKGLGEKYRSHFISRDKRYATADETEQDHLQVRDHIWDHLMSVIRISHSGATPRKVVSTLLQSTRQLPGVCWSLAIPTGVFAVDCPKATVGVFSATFCVLPLLRAGVEPNPRPTADGGPDVAALHPVFVQHADSALCCSATCACPCRCPSRTFIFCFWHGKAD